MINIQQLIDLENEELLSLNSGKKFDIVLMNPPYGNKPSATSPHLHYEFVVKCLDIADKQVSIFPNRILSSTSKEYDKFKEIFDKMLVSVEDVDSREFVGTKMPTVGIFTFDKNKTGQIEYTPLNGEVEYLDSLFDRGSGFDEYEQKIFDYLKTDKPNFNPFRPVGKDKKEQLEQFCDKYIQKRWPDNDKIFLISNLANGAMNAQFFSKNVGQIINKTDELKDAMLQHKGACCTIMTFNTEEEAKNCKDAMKRPLLRFLLYKLQDDQNMTSRVYVCVPDVDWSDPQTTTDEGLLELCGCPKDKCKEYAEYCKEVIEKVDNK